MLIFFKNKKFRLLVFVTAVLLFILTSQWLVNAANDRRWLFSKKANSMVDVFYLDIGQGDSTLIQTPKGENILIDGGPDLSAVYRLGEVLPFYEKRIDLIILTHPDQDHFFGLPEVVRRFQVDEVVLNGVLDDSSSYKFFLDLLAKESVKVSIGQEGKEFRFGEVVVRILFPTQSMAGSVVSDNNVSSQVIKIDFKEISLLFTGDLPLAEESELVKAGINLHAQVAKAGHHGSKTSSGLEFLQAVRPEIMIISAGADNRYGHPHYRVLKNIEKVEAQALRTDVLGTIHIQCNKKCVVIP